MPETRTISEGHLATFDARHAPIIASWVQSTAELFMLAPSTVPPLTPQKIIDWTPDHGHAHTFHEQVDAPPVGYAELNPLKRDPQDLWIGHVLIDPTRRGSGLGTALTRALIRRAFDELDARGLTLVVFPNNVAAINCYHAVGFRTKREEFQRFSPRGKRYRLLRMELTAREAKARRATLAPTSAISARF